MCNKEGDTEKNCIRAIFEAGTSGYMTYTCAVCGKNHIVGANTTIK